MEKYNRQIIYCPQCGRKVATWDGRSQNNVIANCKNCEKRIVFHTDTFAIEVKKIPPRAMSSGKTFY